MKSLCATAGARDSVSAANENICETTRMIPCVIAVDGRFAYKSDFMEPGKKISKCFF